MDWCLANAVPFLTELFREVENEGPVPKQLCAEKFQNKLPNVMLLLASLPTDSGESCGCLEGFFCCTNLACFLGSIPGPSASPFLVWEWDVAKGWELG